MVEIVINDKKTPTFDWKITLKKVFIPVIATMVLAGGDTLIQEITNLNFPTGSLEFVIAGIVIGLIKGAMNWYKHRDK